GYALNRLYRVGDARNDRGQQYAGGDAGLVQLAHHVQPLERIGSARLKQTPETSVYCRDSKVHSYLRYLSEFGEHIDVAQQHRRLRDHPHGIRVVAKRLQSSASHAVVALSRLVDVRGGTQRDLLEAPARPR